MSRMLFSALTVVGFLLPQLPVAVDVAQAGTACAPTRVTGKMVKENMSFPKKLRLKDCLKRAIETWESKARTRYGAACGVWSNAAKHRARTSICGYVRPTLTRDCQRSCWVSAIPQRAR